MGTIKYALAALVFLTAGWDLRLVDWNPVRYFQDVPQADRSASLMLAGAAVIAWLIDRWTSDRDPAAARRPLHATLMVGAGCILTLLLCVQNISEIHGNILALAELPHYVSFWLLLATMLGTLWVYSQHHAPFAPATTHGTAGWAAPAEIKPLAAPKLSRPPLGSLYLGYDRRGREIILPPRLSKQHALTIGTTGSGKTRTVFMPNAVRLGVSFAASDPKGELWKFTSGYQQEAWKLAPRSADSTHGFNWLPLCREEHMAQLLAAAVMQTDEDTREQQFWKLADQQTCAAGFTHVAHSDVPTPATLRELLMLPPLEFVAALKASPVERARVCGQTLAGLRPETASGIVMSVSQKLAFLHDPAVLRFTSCELRPPDFRTLADPDRQIGLYWQVHEEDVDLLKPLSSLFFTLLLHQLCQGEGELPAPVALLLDEFAQVGRIPKFPNTIAVARGRGVSLVLGIQSLAQLDALYGKAGAEVIRTNCCTKIVLPGLDYDTAEHISKALGETTVRQEYQSRRPEGWLVTSYSYGEHHTQRRLMTADEVRRIDDDEALLIIANYKPIRARRVFWDKDPNPASSGQLGEARGLVVREFVSPPPGNNITPLRRGLQRLDDEEES
ncbi:MAG TPA: type IV secretory system conjugative DNA transfer family protein [Chloroflexota bacterium]|nr:type IV secretory system conjugative DNA transfer family protein [Chloroflexota bacterium]